MLNCIVFQFNVCEYVTNAYLRSCTYSIVYAFTYFTEVKKKLVFIRCSATSNNVLDKAIDAEDEMHHDFLRLV
jgi:hypothetical protein